MRIINPAFAVQSLADANDTSADRGGLDWTRDPIAIISNAKPNARELLEGLRAQMSAFRPTDNIDYLFKDSAAQPAPDALYDQVAQSYRGAILALAD